MAITTRDQLLAAMTQKSQLLRVNKVALGLQVVNGYTSYWRVTGLPAQGAIPTAAAICDGTLTGALPFTAPSGGDTLYLARAALLASAVCGVDLMDRLGHMGGLSGTVLTAQAVALDLTGTGSNLVARRGTDFGDVQWWLEWYTATGGTARTATVAFTDHLGNPGTTQVSIPANTSPGRMIPIIGASAEKIRSVESVTLSATTGTAGNFGVTATRRIVSLGLLAINAPLVFDWVGVGLPIVPESACLTLAGVQSATTAPAIVGDYTLVAG